MLFNSMCSHLLPIFAIGLYLLPRRRITTHHSDTFTDFWKRTGRTLHIDTCVNQRVVTRRGKCEKRNTRGRCACPTDLLICFLNLLPPPSHSFFSLREIYRRSRSNPSSSSNPSSPSATSRDVTENTRRAPLRECGRGWAVNLALFILIYTTSVLSSPWIRLPRVVCGLLNARICRFPSDVCVLFDES